MFLLNFELYSLISSCWGNASLIGEAVVHDVEAMLSNVIDVDILADYRASQTFEE